MRGPATQPHATAQRRTLQFHDRSRTCCNKLSLRSVRLPWTEHGARNPPQRCDSRLQRVQAKQQTKTRAGKLRNCDDHSRNKELFPPADVVAAAAGGSQVAQLPYRSRQPAARARSPFWPRGLTSRLAGWGAPMIRRQPILLRDLEQDDGGSQTPLRASVSCPPSQREPRVLGRQVQSPTPRRPHSSDEAHPKPHTQHAECRWAPGLCWDTLLRGCGDCKTGVVMDAAAIVSDGAASTSSCSVMELVEHLTGERRLAACRRGSILRMPPNFEIALHPAVAARVKPGFFGLRCDFWVTSIEANAAGYGRYAWYTTVNPPPPPPPPPRGVGGRQMASVRGQVHSPLRLWFVVCAGGWFVQLRGTVRRSSSR